MKKIMILCLGVMGVIGCVDVTRTPKEDGMVSAVIDPSMTWMLGTWDCVGQYDDAVPPFKIHDESAVYEFSIGNDGDVHGTYTVTPVGNNPVAGTREVWSIGIPVNGEAQASITIAADPGTEIPFTAQASGSVFGSQGHNVQGISEFFSGTITFPGKETVPWATAMFADTFSGSPELLISSYLGQNGLFQYFGSTCSKHTTSTLR